MSIKLTQRQINSNKNKQKIYDTAIMLFKQYDFDTVTVDDICRHSGISKGSFYHYLESKDDLVIIAFINGLDKYLEEYYILDSDSPFREQFIGFLLCMFHFAESVGKDFTRKSYVAQINTQIELRREGRIMVDLLYKLIQRGLDEDAFCVNYNQIEMYTHIIGTFTGLLIKWCTDHVNNFDWEQFIVNQANMLLKKE